MTNPGLCKERYSAKGFQPKPSANKGERKQQEWQEVIESVLNCHRASLSRNERFILELLTKHENVPRKRNKFQNFLRSIQKNRYSANEADSVFDKLEAQLKSGNDKPNENQQKEAEKENTSAEVKKDDSTESAILEEKKLSKKEKKEIRKREKYEAELKEIETNQIESENDAEDKKKKKSKKRKLAEVVEGIEEDKPKTKKEKKVDSQENGNGENGVPEQEELPEGKKSKKKHKKEKLIEELDDGTTENGVSEKRELSEGKKSKKKDKQEENIVENGTEDTVEESSTKTTKSKFSWQDMILQVLSAKEEKEIPLKRLRKKILTEFESMGCGSATDEKIIAKFNKKVHHIPGVVVLKDTVKLVSVE
ncbi:hypothetical protein C0J52_31097 [Blattella germanica]|nr:hypothetical protein C0J52_31097 [Blattella germanica]